MPQQVGISVENNFTKGLITESNSLSFPENAATETLNCDYSLIGEVLRRQGIDMEVNGSVYTAPTRVGNAISTYKWNNAGGDGNTQLIVVQVGNLLFFYNSSNATPDSPISANLLGTTVNCSDFAGVSGFDASVENTYADGNGQLFVFNPNASPFFVSYSGGNLAATAITVQIRDFNGIDENIADNVRPSSLTPEHNYNLLNQGWTTGNPWYLTSTTSAQMGFGLASYTVSAGAAGVTNGQIVAVTAYTTATGFGSFGQRIVGAFGFGTVTGYVGNALQVNIASFTDNFPGRAYSDWTFYPTATGYIGTWFTSQGNYPSNSDVWWYFKDSSNNFNPTITQPQVTVSAGRSPRGHYVMNAFYLDRTAVSGVAGLTPVTTNKRPSNGAWFQGRVWYTGLNDSQASTGDAAFYTWSENIYFSQINIADDSNYGKCYQENDPTSENLNSILPTDGGIIKIQGSGKIYKLFPTQNGLLVFAANGIWFITGSQGIGFAANDYTVTRISAIESISTTSFVDVQGLPYFWNQEGIYAVMPQQGGGLTVESLTVSTIDSFYADIPIASKVYARGIYDPINYTIRWIYRTTPETNDGLGSVYNRYTFDGILNFHTYNKAFFPYMVDTEVGNINSILYVQSPGGPDSIEPSVKYLVTRVGITFADEHDTNYVDWGSVDYSSYFVTGYKIRGQAIKRFQPTYVQTYIQSNGEPFGYKIQSIWDYAQSGDTGRWSTLQTVTSGSTKYNTVYRRHKLRGHGYVVQIKIQSVSGLPFAFHGWAIIDTINQGV